MMPNYLIPFLDTAAYLDPGSGSFLIQALLAAGLGSLITLRLYWKNVVTFFTKKNKSEVVDNEVDEVD